MYLRKTDRTFIVSRIQKIKDMLAEIKILDKTYSNNKDEEIINLYNEKYSYIQIYLEDIQNITNGGK